ncbi:uncharacterized protein [Haliotis cracherodii]|uniref:uncharacterized protein n=1 Tax=Haliotis cracherodii TaxID=6455 RepID=UPI0039E897FC
MSREMGSTDSRSDGCPGDGQARSGQDRLPGNRQSGGSQGPDGAVERPGRRAEGGGDAQSGREQEMVLAMGGQSDGSPVDPEGPTRDRGEAPGAAQPLAGQEQGVQKKSVATQIYATDECTAYPDMPYHSMTGGTTGAEPLQGARYRETGVSKSGHRAFVQQTSHCIQPIKESNPVQLPEAPQLDPASFTAMRLSTQAMPPGVNTSQGAPGIAADHSPPGNERAQTDQAALGERQQTQRKEAVSGGIGGNLGPHNTDKHQHAGPDGNTGLKCKTGRCSASAMVPKVANVERGRRAGEHAQDRADDSQDELVRPKVRQIKQYTEHGTLGTDDRQHQVPARTRRAVEGEPGADGRQQPLPVGRQRAVEDPGAEDRQQPLPVWTQRAVEGEPGTDNRQQQVPVGRQKAADPETKPPEKGESVPNVTSAETQTGEGVVTKAERQEMIPGRCTASVKLLLDYSGDDAETLEDKQHIIHEMSEASSQGDNFKTAYGLALHVLKRKSWQIDKIWKNYPAGCNMSEIGVHNVLKELEHHNKKMGHIVEYFSLQYSKRLDIILLIQRITMKMPDAESPTNNSSLSYIFVEWVTLGLKLILLTASRWIGVCQNVLTWVFRHVHVLGVGNGMKSNNDAFDCQTRPLILVVNISRVMRVKSLQSLLTGSLLEKHNVFNVPEGTWNTADHYDLTEKYHEIILEQPISEMEDMYCKAEIDDSQSHTGYQRYPPCPTFSDTIRKNHMVHPGDACTLISDYQDEPTLPEKCVQWFLLKCIAIVAIHELLMINFRKIQDPENKDDACGSSCRNMVNTEMDFASKELCVKLSNVAGSELKNQSSDLESRNLGEASLSEFDTNRTMDTNRSNAQRRPSNAYRLGGDRVCQSPTVTSGIGDVPWGFSEVVSRRNSEVMNNVLETNLETNDMNAEKHEDVEENNTEGSDIQAGGKPYYSDIQSDDRPEGLDTQIDGAREGSDMQTDGKVDGAREGSDMQTDGKVDGAREGSDMQTDGKVDGKREGSDMQVNDKPEDLDKQTESKQEGSDMQTDGKVGVTREGSDMQANDEAEHSDMQTKSKPENSDIQADDKPQGSGIQTDGKPQGSGIQTDDKPQGSGIQTDDKPQGSGIQTDDKPQGSGIQTDDKPQGSGIQTDDKPKRQKKSESGMHRWRYCARKLKGARKKTKSCVRCRILSGRPSRCGPYLFALMIRSHGDRRKCFCVYQRTVDRTEQNRWRGSKNTHRSTSEETGLQVCSGESAPTSHTSRKFETNRRTEEAIFGGQGNPKACTGRVDELLYKGGDSMEIIKLKEELVFSLRPDQPLSERQTVEGLAKHCLPNKELWEIDKLMQSQRAGQPREACVDHVLQELIAHGLKVGHVVQYFSQDDSRRDDVVRIIKNIHPDCQFCTYLFNDVDY